MITSGSMSFLKAVLLEGEFMSALPRCVLKQELEVGTLVTIPYPGGPVCCPSTGAGFSYRRSAISFRTRGSPFSGSSPICRLNA